MNPITQARWWFLGALVVALIARLPGVFWGANFPGGWLSHHPDEYTHIINTQLLIDPEIDLGWTPHPYPKGMAAMVAAPAIAASIATGRSVNPPPRQVILLLTGRIVSVCYGVATVAMLMLLGLRLFRDWRIGALGGWILALGGLHVTQSHFFLSDVSGLFWLLLGQYLLLRDLDGRPDHESLRWAALSLGAAFGMKLVVAALPTLALACLWRPGRIQRTLHAAIFFVAGYTAITLGSSTAHDLYRVLLGGIGDPYTYSRALGALLYAIELPSVVSLPIALLGVVGLALLARGWWGLEHPARRVIGVVIVLPMVIQLGFVLFKLDHFPRHLIPFIPWLALGAAWSLLQLADRRRLRPAWLVAPVLLYLALFVADGERGFLNDPRNQAAQWVRKNLTAGSGLWWNTHTLFGGYHHVRFPSRGRPPVLVVQMMDANHYLRGMSLTGPMPRDVAHIFDAGSAEDVAARQALFTGASEYREAARFTLPQWMPEYRLTDRLLGNRSRNYLSDVVIFVRDSTAPPAPESP